MRPSRALILLVVLLAWGAVGARADKLVTRDGNVIETRGPWEIRGKLVVFTLADGTLASLRLSEADLEASAELARATEARQRRASEPPAEPARREAALVLTDRDVAHVDPEASGAEPGEEEGPAAMADGEAPAGDAVAGSGGSVQVVQWSQQSDAEAGTMELRGVIQNLTSNITTNLSVNALFYDETGGLLAARDVPLEGVVLRPSARHEFSVPLPHALVYDEVKFQVVGRGFRSRSQSVRPPAVEEPSPEEP